MRNLIYILLFSLFFSCSQKQESPYELNNPSSDTSTMDEVSIVEENQSNEYESTAEATEIIDSSTDIIKQQLQESLNLILLSNKIQISDELNKQLTEAINDMVKTYSVNKGFDILKITEVEIIEQTEITKVNQVKIAFKALTKTEKTVEGKATAMVSTETVNIDGQDFINYQVFFENIVLE